MERLSRRRPYPPELSAQSPGDPEKLALGNAQTYLPSKWMDLIAMPKLRTSVDTEKITVNLGYVDLGRIDLLVQEGFYSNRTDFIRTAIRAQLTTHTEVVGALIERRTLDIGLRDFTRTGLEAARAAGEVPQIKVVGLARIAPDVDPGLAQETIASITVLGALQAPAAVRAAIADRIF